MFLSRFCVRGYKCLHDVDLALRPCHVVCGPASSGKTSLLEAIAAMLGRLKTPSSEWFPPVKNMRDLVERGALSPTIDISAEWSELTSDAVELTVPLAGFGYSIVLPDRGNTPGVMDQWVRPTVANTSPVCLMRRTVPFPRAKSGPTPDDVAAQDAFRNVIQKALQPTTIYQLRPLRLATPAVDMGQGLTLEADGLGLAVLLDTLRAELPERYQALEAAFALHFPEFCGFAFEVEPTAADRRRKTPPPLLKSLLFRSAAGHATSALHVSGSALLTLGYLALAQLTEPPGPLLIEMPEAGLQPERLSAVLQILNDSTIATAEKPGTQVIMTTHSAQVIGSVAKEELSRLSA